MKRFAVPLFLTLILAACALARAILSQPTPQPVDPTQVEPVPVSSTGSAAPSLTRSDEQGAVVFAVTPLNLTTASDTLEFDVAMNTHSVDLSMDLATLATLTTDTGVTVQATKWNATPGGHHVSGTLIFPARKDGRSALAGTSKLTLTIVNIDAVSRVFEWELN